MSPIQKLEADLAKALEQNRLLVEALHHYGYDAEFGSDGELHLHGIDELDSYRCTWVEGEIEPSPTGEFIYYDVHLARLRELGVDV